MRTQLTACQIRYIMKLISEDNGGGGWAPPEAVLEDGSSVGSLQAHLSIKLQMAGEREAAAAQVPK